MKSFAILLLALAVVAAVHADCSSSSSEEVVKTTTTTKKPPPTKKPKCGKNEVWDRCRANPACEDTCADPYLSQNALCKCVAGCACKVGYLRDANRRCIAKDECGCGGDPNAFFDLHANDCFGTCANGGCPPDDCDPDELRSGACRCRAGYVFDYGWKCIKLEDCPACSGPNEFYDCGSACDTTCATLGQPCPIETFKCTEMCYCAEGFARDCDGVCVPIDECPGEPTTTTTTEKPHDGDDGDHPCSEESHD